MKGLADIQVTLYDIFGYLLPGLVTLGATTIFSWAVFTPGSTLTTPKLSGAWWIAIFVTSYLLGHLIQAIANELMKRVSVLRPRADDALAWTQHGDAIATKLGFHRRENEDHEPYAERVFEAADIVVAQRGNTEDRQIYIYREGFYRGLAVAFALALVAVVVRALHSGDAVIGQHHVVTTGEYWFASLTLLVAVVLSHHRYCRFSAYKLHNSFVAFAALTELIKLPKKES